MIKKFKLKTIPNKIKKLRGNLNWSQAELSRRAGVTPSMISRYEKGTNIPSLSTIIKLADAFDVHISEFGGVYTGLFSKAQFFFSEYGDITRLSATDQQKIQSMVKRLKNITGDKK